VPYPSPITRRAFLASLGASLAALSVPPALTAHASAAFRMPTPPTLMLHTKDRWKLVRIAQWLVENGYTGITYRQLYEVMTSGGNLPARPIILTIDDIGSHYIQPRFLEMADVAEQAGFKGVFGVVTREPLSRKPEIWRVLRELDSRGWEMDSHSNTHSILPSLKADDLREEIVGSAKRLADGIGRPPFALIAPYGNVYERGDRFDLRIFEYAAEVGLKFVVGIAGGRSFDATQPAPYYVGRVGVGTDQVQTGWWIKNFYGRSR